MERWNAENARVEERTRVRRKQTQVREMLGKLRNGSRGTWFIPMICGSGCSKSRLVKATGAEPPFLHPFCILFVHAVLNELYAMWLLLVAWEVDWICFCFKQCACHDWNQQRSDKTLRAHRLPNAYLSAPCLHLHDDHRRLLHNSNRPNLGRKSFLHCFGEKPMICAACLHLHQHHHPLQRLWLTSSTKMFSKAPVQHF